MKKILWLIPFVVLSVWHSPWIIASWRHSPLDHWGPSYVLLAILAGAVGVPVLKRIEIKTDAFALLIIIPGLLGCLAGWRLDIHLVFSAAALLALSGMVWLLWGWMAWLWALPLFGLLVLSLPTITYLLDLSAVTLLPSIGINAQWIKALCGLFLVIVYGIICTWFLLLRVPRIRRSTFLFLTGLVLILVTTLYSQTPTIIGPARHPVLEEMRLNGWSGTEMPLTPAEKGFFRGCSFQKLVFYNQDNEAITVIRVSSPGDMHRLHPPEYCLAGSGWSILKRTRETIRLDGSPLSVMTLQTERKDQHLLVCYYFTSTDQSTPSHMTFRGLAGKHPDQEWSLYLFSMTSQRLDEDDWGRLYSFMEAMYSSS